MISIQQMNYILVLSEELNFVRASDRCFVTQPTLSMQIKKAEEILGHVIFERTIGPMKLTAFGTQLLPIIRNVLNEYDGILELTEKSKGTHRQIIRLGIIPTVASYMIPDLYDTWRSELQNVQLIIEELKTKDLLDALNHGKIDIGILSGPIEEQKFRMHPLYTEEIKAYSPSFKQKKMSTDDLVHLHPWLLTPGNCLRTQMMHFCQLKNETTNDEWDYQGGNIDLLIDMVDKHGGYTLVPENHIRVKSTNYKSIESSTGEFPARVIVALMHNRTKKWGIIEKIVRACQVKYTAPNNQKFKTLSWN